MMKKTWILLALVLLLSGCASTQTFETVEDDLVTPVMGQMKQVVLTLPKSAASPVVNTDDGSRLFLCDGYDLTVQTLVGGDLNRTVKQLCGYGASQVTVLESELGGSKRYEWVWTSAGEGGDQIGRAVVIADGQYHYCVCIMADAATAGMLDGEWTKILSGIALA